jgi:hypothetical protein
MTQPTTDRLQSCLRGINAALNPRQVFALTWEYQVIAASPGPPVKIDCQVLDPETSAHLPAQLTQLVLWPGPSGCIAVPQPGSIVRIGFVNGDPSKPMVVGLDPAGSPLLVMLAGAVGPFVSRIGDTVTITPAQVVSAAMVAGGNPVTAGATLLGTITSGSAKVQSP